ncbi:hypothetical protein DV515_00011487 [Chloebia gouldiae]|uniref:Uncharacterized protein n=1 Tax=Chloebia gouldiae TaxID=44316 RepID=A0A3L8S6A5_CHLGU|nr:hypothetical protein DV515_00011487 [Chloebia gouldiae]
MSGRAEKQAGFEAGVRIPGHGPSKAQLFSNGHQDCGPARTLPSGRALQGLRRGPGQPKADAALAVPQRLRELERGSRSLLRQRLRVLHRLHGLLQRDKAETLRQLQEALEQLP